MTIPREATKPRVTRRAIAAVVTAAALTLATGYAANASVAASRMFAARPAALLSLIGSPQAANPALSDLLTRLVSLNEATVRTAVAATPLDQHIVNVAMVRAVRRKPQEGAEPWLALLARLGWRDTVAAQNMLYTAGQAGNLARILDLSDALMRRQQLTDQLIPVLMAVEGDDQLRRRLINRLADQPGWRAVFLTATGLIKTPAQRLARFDTIRALQRRGTQLDAGEVVPAIIALDGAGMSEQGFALWRSIRPDATEPLDDTRFALASRSYDDDRDPVPYQWRMATGQGFSAEATNDGEQAALTIDWDGRGVPVFAQQRTSAAPGLYAMEVRVAPEDVADLSALSFKMRCDEDVIPLRADPPALTRFVTVRRVPCGYPSLEISGELQGSAVAHQLSIQRIVLRPLAH